ncbi:MAG: type II toxin-antitoxin system HicB family antitoxin [Gammaproteobacteria bacterium]|nr:type II toxin-antitoxin system HicB family antitoxin [Gammaproteobacteria bacterium]
MQYAYPCVLTSEDDGVSVSFPDIPEALTCGDDRSDALVQASDALVTALCAYVYGRESIPTPSPVVKGQELIAVPLVVAAKLALYSAMRQQGMSKTGLARRLGLSEGAVRKLLDPDHRSHIGQVEKALSVLGHSLIIADRAA